MASEIVSEQITSTVACQCVLPGEWVTVFLNNKFPDVWSYFWLKESLNGEECDFIAKFTFSTNNLSNSNYFLTVIANTVCVWFFLAW